MYNSTRSADVPATRNDGGDDELIDVIEHESCYGAIWRRPDGKRHVSKPTGVNLGAVLEVNPKTIPGRAHAADEDDLIHLVYDDDRAEGRNPFRALRGLGLAYVTHRGLSVPEMAVLWDARCVRDKSVENRFIGYTVWMPFVAEKLFSPFWYGFDRVCLRAEVNWAKYGTMHDACLVNDRGEHWLTECLGQTKHTEHVADVGTEQAAYDSRPLITPRSTRIDWSKP